jgi:carotenoid cleavage dioxygenase
VKYDHDKGTREVYHYPRGWFPSETAFARSTGATEEDHGYCVTLATDISDYRSEAWIFDARDIQAGPITRIEIPGRVPAGFHAAWFYGRDLWPQRAPAREAA